MPLNGTKTVERTNHINSMDHKVIRNCPEHGSMPRTTQRRAAITKNQRNALTPAIHDLNVIWSLFFAILNKIDRPTFTTRKAQFV